MIIPEESEAEEPPPLTRLLGGPTDRRTTLSDALGAHSSSISPRMIRPGGYRLGLDVDIPSDSRSMRQFLSPTNLPQSWLISPSSSSSDYFSSSRLHWRQLMTLHKETKAALFSPSSSRVTHTSPSLSVPSSTRVPGLARDLVTLSSGNSLSSLSLDRERFPRSTGLMMHSAPVTLDVALRMPCVNEFNIDMHELFESGSVSMRTHRKPLATLDSAGDDHKTTTDDDVSATHITETHRLRLTGLVGFSSSLSDPAGEDPVKLKLDRSHSNEETGVRKKAHSLSLTQSSQSDGAIIERERMLPPREILAKPEKLDSTFELASYQPRNDYEDSYLDDESAVISIDRSIQKEASSTTAISDMDVDQMMSGFSVVNDDLYPDSRSDPGSDSSVQSSPTAASSKIHSSAAGTPGKRSKPRVVQLSDHISLTTADDDLITNLTIRDTLSDDVISKSEDTSTSHLSAHPPRPTPVIGRALLMDKNLATLSESHSNRLGTAPKLYPFDSPPSFDRKTVWSADSADSIHDISQGDSKEGSSADRSGSRLDEEALAAVEISSGDSEKKKTQSGFDIRGLMRTTTTESIEFPEEEDEQLTSALTAKVTHASSSKMVFPSATARRYHTENGDTSSSEASSEAKKGRLDSPAKREIEMTGDSNLLSQSMTKSPVVSSLDTKTTTLAAIESAKLKSMASLPSVINMNCNHCWMVTNQTESSIHFEKLTLKRLRQKIGAADVLDSELFAELKKDPRYTLIAQDTLRLCETSVLISEFVGERMETGLCWQLQSSVSGWMFCPSGIRVVKQSVQYTMVSASEPSPALSPIHRHR